MIKQNKNNLKLLFILILIAYLPTYYYLKIPSINRIETDKDIIIAHLTTYSNNRLEIHLTYGDVFEPKKISNDIGFDLVGISCFFDPIKFDSTNILPINPLLISAIYQSIIRKDTNEFKYFLENLLTALNRSRTVIKCILKSPQINKCNGDEIVPYIWRTYPNSKMRIENGVNFLAALPLFDPNVLFNFYSPSKTRDRLSHNVQAVVRRLINYDIYNTNIEIRSIAFAALGSTSHKGGDSPYFLTFKEGFFSIIKALYSTRPPNSLDRVYLVAYNKHTGIFKHDALKSLQLVAGYFLLNKLFSGTLSILFYGILVITIFLISIIYYNRFFPLLKDRRVNRWNLFGNIVGISVLLPNLIYYGTKVSFSLLPMTFKNDVIFVYIVLCLLSVSIILFLNKHFKYKKTAAEILRDLK